MAVHIESSMQFSKLLGSSTIVVSDFYADWCGPCKAIAPTGACSHNPTSMPTFLIFRSGAVIETIQGADVRKLTTAIENAVKLAGAPKPSFSSPGQTLGGSAPTRSTITRQFSFDRLLHDIIAFFGLYLYSLFSFDAYTAAENSPFNIHKVPAAPAAKTPGGRTGASTQVGKKLGTIADIAGKD